MPSLYLLIGLMIMLVKPTFGVDRELSPPELQGLDNTYHIELSEAKNGRKIWTNRTYTFTSIPSFLVETNFFQTRGSAIPDGTDMNILINPPSIIYIAPTSNPDYNGGFSGSLPKDGWTLQKDQITTCAPKSWGTLSPIWSKNFKKGGPTTIALPKLTKYFLGVIFVAGCVFRKLNFGPECEENLKNISYVYGLNNTNLLSDCLTYGTTTRSNKLLSAKHYIRNGDNDIECPTENPECELKDNIYWHGGAKTRIVENVDSPMDCCKLCKKDADCTKFSYGKVGQHYSKKCYLKKGGTEDFLRGKYFISSRMDISGCGCGDNSMIDENHLKDYPYCGSMYQKRAMATSRISNAKDATKTYRWVVLVTRWNARAAEFGGGLGSSYCSGTVITDRHVLTAGHCVCSKKSSDEKSGYFCRGGGQTEAKKNDNIIQVDGGSPKREILDKEDRPLNLERWTIDYAYVMDGPQDTWTHDIGILRTSNDESFFNKKDLEGKEKLSKLYHAKIVPICLTALTTDIYKEKTIRGVGWGLRYEETDESVSSIRNPVLSSCMTNEVGEENWKFKGCDMHEIVQAGYTCQKGNYPPNYQPKVQQCKQNYIDAAKTLRTKNDKRKLNIVDKIYIINPDGNNEVCYKPEHFTQTGWCRADAPEPDAWGFCSPSCDHDLMQGGIDGDNNEPDIYQEMTWSAYEKHDKDNECMATRNVRHFKPEYTVCMKSELPSARVGKFERDSQSGSLTWLAWEDEEPPSNAKAYILPCSSDSGSGQWITNGLDEDDFNKVLDLKHVLMAVTVARYGIRYENPKGVYHDAPCGRDMYYPGSNTYKHDAAGSQIITHPEIFNWIKDQAGIP